MRKTYGNTWWGKKWLDAFNNIDYSNRLPRGRTYANTGKVKSIEIDINKISGLVQGSRRTPYRIDVTVPKFNKQTKEKIIAMIIEDPMLLSQLLNRELPSYLNDNFMKEGIHLFPKSWDDLKASCSCPDWALPCKHLAAVLYMIANEIDKNPFLVFELHDLDVLKELEQSGFSLDTHKQITIPQCQDLWSKKVAKTTKTEQPTEELYRQLDFTTIPESKKNILAIVEEYAVFYLGKSFRALLDKNYSKISRSVTRLIKKTATIEKKDDALFERIENVRILLDEDLDITQVIVERGEDEPLHFGEIEHFMGWLESVPPGRIQAYVPSLQAVYMAYQFTKKLAQKSAFIPQILQFSEKTFGIRWIPALLNEAVRQLATILTDLMPVDLIEIEVKGTKGKSKPKEKRYPIKEDISNQVFSLFLNYFVQTYSIDIAEEDNVGLMFFKKYTIQFGKFEDKEFPASIHLYLNRFFIAEKDYVPLLRIEENQKEGTFDLAVFIEEKNKEKATKPVTIKELFDKKKYAKKRLDVLRDLATLSNYFPDIQPIITSKGAKSISFNSSAFPTVLLQILPTIRLFGIKTLLPKSLRKLLKPKLSLALSVEEDSTVISNGIVSLENILDFDWRVAIGDKLLTATEFYKMLKEMSGIVRFGDAFVLFDEKEIELLLEKIENPPKLEAQELFQIALAEEYDEAKVILDKKAQKLMKSLLGQKTVKIPEGLKANLRPYQQRGYEWMYKNTSVGFGSLIADDMGLGKTLQVITTLLKLKEDGLLKKKKGLVIVPTTLLTNWDKEIKKFAPSLLTHIYHGTNRKLEVKDIDVLITTYGVVRSDTAKLQKQKWLAIVIDEAQNIKNPSTAQTKAVKKIKGDIRIAMSGTPVENRLSEYWSIFDFVNKGYLSTLPKFKKKFSIPIEVERDQKKVEIFRAITSPFIMRRLKSDKSIIQDLPDKIETNLYCELTKDQTALYQSVIDTTMKQVESTEGIDRKGAVLKLITALKQVCNHPVQFLKKGEVLPQDSGKSVQLLDLLKRIEQNGEKTLIFTQYQTMGKLMVEMIKAEMGFTPPFLHGGVSRKKRDEMVEDFQTNQATKVLILSLKAGGTGLNLTAANNVIHYDLWWNPAVEAQATDRAYRIGQHKNVMVHRFITEKTFEEKIDKLLQSKKDLANLTVTSGEKWIGDLTNNELRNLVSLDK